VRKKYGPYVYDEEERQRRLSFREVVLRPPYELDNNAIYVGEWSKEGLR
jgi:hypothetical protein